MGGRDDATTDLKAAVFEFDGVRVDACAFKVLKAGEPLALEPKTLLLLIFLIENRHRLVTKTEILDAIWKDVAVTENALVREVAKLRRSLGDDPKSPRYIQTVHTRGYRFIAPVQVLDGTVETPAGPAAKPRRWYWAAAFVTAAVFCAALGVALLVRRDKAEAKPLGEHGKPITLAVLPFQPLRGGTTDNYIGIGMADAVITRLGNNSQLAVRPLSTVLHFDKSSPDSLAVGRSLNVDYVLEGKYLSLDDRLRVTVQLLCITCDGASRWAASYDETSGDIFHLQDSVSQRVAAALTPELSGDRYRQWRETSDLEAYMASVKGKFFSTYDTKEDAENSVAFFEKAVQLDPKDASAWALLADSYHRLEWYGAAPSELIPKSRAAARRAVELDDTLVSAHAALGLIAFQYDWDLEAAGREYRRMQELAPRYLHQWTARYLFVTGQAAAAEDVYRRFSGEAPFSVAGSANYAEFLVLSGRYERAQEQIRKTLELDSKYPRAHELLGLVFEQEGHPDKALGELQRAIELSDGLIGTGSLGHLYASAGRREEAQRLLQSLDRRANQGYVAPFEYALIHAGLGQADRALEDLRRGYQERSLSAQALKFDPRLGSVRRQAGYREFTKRIGLP